jgi:hypothetical protein
MLMLSYMLESPLGRWSDDGSHFVYDIEKVSAMTGYTLQQVRREGPAHCLMYPRWATASKTATPRPPQAT